MNGRSMGEGYEKTKPYHPIYNLAVFPMFAFLLERFKIYLWAGDGAGAIWLLLTLIIDFVGWVMIQAPMEPFMKSILHR